MSNLVIPSQFHYNGEETYNSNLYQQRFYHMVLESDYRFMEDRKLTTEAKREDVVEGFDVVFTGTYNWGTYSSTLQGEGWIADIHFRPEDNDIAVVCVARTPEILADFFKIIAERCPELPEDDENTVPVSFWMRGPQGPESSVRQIDINKWDDIAKNYPTKTRSALQQLNEMTDPGSAGKLILWHGDPGTGKTHTIRSLIKTWQPWCQPHYVVDPESFFGSAAYLMQVLLGNNRAPGVKEKWRLLILEDTDEFLVADAKARTGQALSRLLNVADGMIGQGMKVLILITTNEPMSNLHPAVAREGRCLANVHFDKFSNSEAAEWLRDRGYAGDIPRGESTLAELYEKLRKEHIKTDQELVSMGTYL